MSDHSNIGWTEATWNPVTGCEKISPGCKFCYAKRDWARLSANPKSVYFGREFEDVRFHPERLMQVVGWKRPRRIFVNSMSDLFHKDVPDTAIDRIVAAMVIARQHVFQVLTKRAERQRDYVRALGTLAGYDRLEAAARELGHTLRYEAIPMVPWPLPNVWWGISAENEDEANKRCVFLQDTPSVIPWVSYEPALELVDFRPWPAIRWIVVGGESGSQARAFDLGWARQTIEHCRERGIACFVKQLGARCYDGRNPLRSRHSIIDGRWIKQPKGADPAEWPEDLRVQEYPEAA